MSQERVRELVRGEQERVERKRKVEEYEGGKKKFSVVKHVSIWPAPLF